MMYIPRQWRTAFPITLVACIGLGVALVLALQRGQLSVAVVCGGAITGLLSAIAWTLRHFAPRGSAALVGPAAVPAILLWLMSPSAGVASVGVAAGLFATWFIIYDLGITARANREVVSRIVSVGSAAGRPRVLIVYHSTHGQFQPMLQRALAEGLQSQGWAIDMTTASRATPRDLSAYDLLVLGAPSYNWQPARPTLSYLDRLGDLNGMPVAVVVSGGGMTDRAAKILSERVTRARGRLVEALEVWSTRSNVEHSGLSDPQEIMRRAGARLAQSLGKCRTSLRGSGVRD